MPEDGAEAAMAIEKIKDVSSHGDDAERAGLPLESLISTCEHDIQGGDSMIAWKALKRLSTQDWWTRAWIIQEAICSTPTTLHYGAHSVWLLDSFYALLIINLLMQVNASMNSIEVVGCEGWMYYTVINAYRLLNIKKGLQLRELMPHTRGSR